MAIMDILNETINPCELAKKKKDAYKQFVKSILYKVINCVDAENWEALNELCFDSPAGDAYGRDNTVLDFSPDKIVPVDIMGAAYITEYYNRVARGIIKPEVCATTEDLIDRASRGWYFPTYENGADLEN